MSIKTKEIRTHRQKLEFRADEGKPPVVEGYAAVFNSPTDLGGIREVVRPGAFTRTLKDQADVRLLINHDPHGLPLGRTKSGTLELSEDDHGLKIRAELDPSDPDVQRLLPKMAPGDVDQMSFGFYTVSDSWATDEGKSLRELTDLDLFDVSIVTYPAYDDTQVALRSRDQFLAQQEQQSTPAKRSVEVDRLRLLVELDRLQANLRAKN